MRPFFDYYRLIFSKAFSGAYGVGQFFGFFGAFVVTAVSNYDPRAEGMVSDAIIYLTGGAAAVTFIGRFVLAPVWVHQEQQKALDAARAEYVEISSSSYPIMHKEQGGLPTGWFLLVPNLHIEKHGDRQIDLDIMLEARFDGTNYMLGVENRELWNVAQSLPGSLAGQEQLREPLIVAGNGRRVGYFAFRLDGLPEAALNDKPEDTFERLNLVVYDGLTHTEVTQHEVWPSFWPEVFDRSPDPGAAPNPE